MGMHKDAARWSEDRDGDYWCDDCDKPYSTKGRLFSHFERSSKHNFCRTCDRDFTTSGGLRSHFVNSREHHFCTFCDKDHDDDDALQEHKKRAHAKCEGCGRWFETEEGSFQHGRQSHPFCAEHRRAFRSEANLKAHLASSDHVRRTFFCPTGCGASFVSRSATVLHIEAGTCTSGATRQKLDFLIQKLDQQNHFTIPGQKLLTAPDPTTSQPAPPPPPKYLATQRSWDPDRQAYRCPLCNSARFRSLFALNQHLSSPAHASTSEGKLYRCPHVKCGKQFSTLSGLVQHAESDSCGLWSRTNAKEEIDRVLGGMKALTM